ncbi:hypothetical protein F2Q68_00024166 [Brassica cretica]|uniref:Uncharacterized protein n=1 Tax=Brassica cretica TaxID=69181 RepID=A0A8S9IDQ1_BRACR|nr:hypothetical protein F2Q68_00024166 [Brassica cretica]
MLEVNKSPTDPSENLAQAKEKFIPSMGSWAKPLYFKPPATPPDPSTPRDYDPAVVGNQLATLWPTLNDEILNKQPKGKYSSGTLQPPIEKLPPPELKADGRLRFPWAARLSPQSRNLYRAATPTYRIDGTPEVSIPSKVLKLGPENKDEYIIGKFHKCALPPGGLVHAVVNRIWGRSSSLPTEDYGAHGPEKRTIEIEGLLSELEATPTFQQENPTASPNFIPTLPTLVDSQSTPTTASIMESSPSTVINIEVSEALVVGPLATTHTPFAFESPAQFKGSRDVGLEDGTEPSSSLSLTRGGRETKPPSKYQDMEWKTVRGRGKRGRRGHGSYH